MSACHLLWRQFTRLWGVPSLADLQSHPLTRQAPVELHGPSHLSAPQAEQGGAGHPRSGAPKVGAPKVGALPSIQGELQHVPC